MAGPVMVPPYIMGYVWYDERPNSPLVRLKQSINNSLVD